MTNAQNQKKYKINNQSNAEKEKNPRIYALVFLISGIALVIFFRLYSLQVSAHDSYLALAENQHSIFKNLVPERGEIYLKDRDALYPVAVNKEVGMAFAVPKEIQNPADVSNKLASILGLDRDQLFSKLSKENDMYEVLKHRLSDDEAKNIANLKIKGVYLTDEALRYYPAGELAANVLGFVGWRNNEFGGRYGTELYFNDQLKGQPGSLFQSRDSSGRWIATGDKTIAYAKNGDSYVLTIDHAVQYETEKILKAAIEKFQATRGTIVVMDSATGKILAMASYPTFNPNDYAKEDNMDAFRNLAVSDPYECGSVFKAITLASAVDAGKITPDTTYIDTGTVEESGYAIHNSDLKGNGVQTMTQVLEKSLNTGAIFAEKSIGNATFLDYIKKFGFGALTGADFYGEANGNISNLNNLKSNIQFFTASYGQGITVTPLQLVSAYNAIANNGILLKPQIVEKVIHADGTSTEIPTQEVRRVISQEAANLTKKMLRSVVTNGHGKQADVPGYSVSGKTGTAQVASNTSKGYADGQSIGSFAGFAPIDNPKITMLVRMDDPKTVPWAESSAAPTFGELMKFILGYYNIEPTETYLPTAWDKFNQTHTLENDFLKTDQPGIVIGNTQQADLTNQKDKKQ